MKKNNRILIILVSLVGALIVAYLVAGSSFLQTESGEDGDLKSFAQCLTERGFVMYGAETCSFCIKQKKLFGDGAKFIKEIECDPRFKGHQVEVCIERDIKHTPTWMQEDEEGNEIQRFSPGLLSLETLSELSACPLIENET